MSEVTVNTDQVLAMFDELDFRRRRQVYRATLNTSSNILVRQAKQNLRRTVKTTRNKNKWNGKTLESGIKKRVARDAKSATVSIMGDFRLKFFEMGTKDRNTKGRRVTGSYFKGGRNHKIRVGRGGFRGRIDASRFFTQARQSTEKQIFAEIDSTLSRHIQRINNKYANGTTSRGSN